MNVCNLGVWVRELPCCVDHDLNPQCALEGWALLMWTGLGTMLLAEHKPSSWAVLLLFPEQLLAAPPGVFAFLSSSLHAACHRQGGTFLLEIL